MLWKSQVLKKKKKISSDKIVRVLLLLWLFCFVFSSLLFFKGGTVSAGQTLWQGKSTTAGWTKGPTLIIPHAQIFVKQLSDITDAEPL